MLIRNEQALPMDDALRVERGDRITWLADLSEKETLADLCQAVTPSIKRYYGDFTVRGDVLVGDLMAIYGVGTIDDRSAAMTVATLFRRRVGSQPVVGDTLMLGGLRLRVRAVEGGRVSQVGIRLPH
jgi:cell volume regulation protein A